MVTSCNCLRHRPTSLRMYFQDILSSNESLGPEQVVQRPATSIPSEITNPNCRCNARSALRSDDLATSEACFCEESKQYQIVGDADEIAPLRNFDHMLNKDAKRGNLISDLAELGKIYSLADSKRLINSTGIGCQFGGRLWLHNTAPVYQNVKEMNAISVLISDRTKIRPTGGWLIVPQNGQCNCHVTRRLCSNFDPTVQCS